MVNKKSEEEEIEEVSKEEDESSNEEINEVLEDEENFNEVSDFSFGDVGLTADSENSRKGVNLEESLDGEILNRWEKQDKKSSEEEELYNNGRRNKNYSEIERGSDIYTDDGRGDLYSAKSDGGEFYDPRIEIGVDKHEVRSVGISKLEIKGFQKMSGQIEKEIRDKMEVRKYN